MKFNHALFLVIFCLTQIHHAYASVQPGLESKSIPAYAGKQIDAGEFFIENHGLKIWYKVSGEGPVCILPTPGWGPGSELYYNSMHEMEEVFTMVYMDTRGSGRSDRPEMDQYTTSNLLSDMEAVRKDLGVREVWLMGHSKGGALVLNYAFENEKNVRGIILIDASGGVNTPPEKMQAIMSARKDEAWFAPASEYFNRQARDEADWITGTKAIMPMYFSSSKNFENCKDVLTETSMSYHAFRGQFNWTDCEKELGSKLGSIEIPVLVVVGMEDFICGPYVAIHLHGELPNSKLLPIESAGHFPWLEQPEAFFPGIREFLPKMKSLPSGL